MSGIWDKPINRRSDGWNSWDVGKDGGRKNVQDEVDRLTEINTGLKVEIQKLRDELRLRTATIARIRIALSMDGKEGEP